MAQRIISFELTMPNKGSWNGKWSGENDKYFIINSYSEKYLNSKDYFKRLLDKGTDSWYYNFGDGWGANVQAQIIDGIESRKRRKASKGFCGYDWMVESILFIGKIDPDYKKQMSESINRPLATKEDVKEVSVAMGFNERITNFEEPYEKDKQVL